MSTNLNEVPEYCVFLHMILNDQISEFEINFFLQETYIFNKL